MVTRVIQYFRFPDKPMEGGGHLGFLERGEMLEKGGGYDPPYQLCRVGIKSVCTCSSSM